MEDLLQRVLRQRLIGHLTREKLRVVATTRLVDFKAKVAIGEAVELFLLAVH